MARIKVDTAQFDKTAAAIDTYVSAMKSKMASANGTVSGIKWAGKDASAFLSRWDLMMSGDSTYMRMAKALESYARYLRYAGKSYGSAAEKACSRANRLPRG